MSFSFPGDLKNTTLLGYSIVPGTTISSDTTTSGTAVDCLLVEGPMTAFFLTGNAGDGSTLIQFKVQESDTSGGSYTDVTDGVLTARAASATLNDNLVIPITFAKRTKRYLKCVVVTSGGGTPSVPCAAFVLGRLKISGSGTGYQS
jgi:hypothetical protein